jgi:hypothetical protein
MRVSRCPTTSRFPLDAYLVFRRIPLAFHSGSFLRSQTNTSHGPKKRCHVNGSSVFGVAGFVATPSVCVFLTVNLPGFMGCRSFRISIFALQIPIRNPDA